MSNKQTIDIGSGELSGDGESLRSAFNKTNENFDELYSTKADKTEVPTKVSDLPNDAGYITQDAIPTDFKGTLVGDDSTILADGVNSSINLDGTVKGNVIPDADNAYDLGSADKQFRSLYVSSNTIFVDGTALGVADGKIQIEEDGEQVDVASRNYVDEQVSQAVIDANGIDLFGYVQAGDNVSRLTNDSNFATETYVNTAEANVIATAASDATTKANQAEADANEYTDTRETAITTAYESYADTAKDTAIASAASDATTKADAAETAANEYTDDRETAITSAYQTYANQAETNAIATAASDATTKADAAQTAANEYTDERETAITTAYESYADQAETNAIATAASDATTKANQAETNAIATAASDATTKADAAQSAANEYTDERETAITTAYRTYADDAQADAQSYADGVVSTAVTTLQVSISSAESDAINAAQNYTNTQITNLVGTSPATLDTLEEIAQALGDDPNAVGTITAALTNRVRTDVDNQGLSAGDKLNARTNIGLGTAATQDTSAFATAAQGALADSALQSGDNISVLANDSGYLTTVAFADLTTTPTTLSGYGITDAATSAQGTKADNALPAASVSAYGETLIDDLDAATARTTLGLGTAATTASTDYATAAQGTLADSALQSSDNISELTNDAGYITAEDVGEFASEAYVDQAELDAIATSEAYTDTAKNNAIATAAADATTKANQAEADANTYTDERENAITTAYQNYADTAEADAITAAATDATVKADAALSSAKTYTDSEISSLIDNSPGVIDTLNEIAQALGNDENFAANITNLINNNKNDADNKFLNLLSIAGDDSTQRQLSQSETLQFIGGTNIGTSVDAEGTVTITNAVEDLFDLGIVDALPGQILATDGAGVAAFASPDTFGGNRVYVSAAKGNDANDGINQPVASIKKALQIASGMVYNGDSDVVDAVTIMIASGEYTLDNPVIIPDSVSIVGDNLRRVIIRPQNANKDMFRVRNSTYITNVTFRDTADLTSTFRYAISFDNVNDADTSRVGYTNLPTAKPTITTSPYVQNCSVISFLGANGVEIDGDLIISPNVPADAAEAERPQVGDVPEYGKSMVGNAFTILSFGGTAWRVINDAYAQIVSCFVIFTEQGCLTQNGGYLSITNSATNFGLYALRSTGYSPNSFTFNRGYISGNGIEDSTQTLRAVGLGQGAIEQYVLRFRNSSDVDITDNFNSNGSLGISADWVASTDSVSGSSVTFATAHGMSTGDVVEYNSNDNVEIVGLLNEVTYYITANNANTITLYHDEARTRPVRFLDASVTSGTHTFKTGYEEFFVQEVLDTHNIYQDITLAVGTYNPVIGDTIIGTDGADTITAIISAWDSGTRTLTVSIELTGEQRNKFSPSATINAGELVAGAVDIDSVTDRADLFTSNFKVFSTLDRTVQNIGSLNSNQVWLHRPSILNSSAHTWEYAGSGTDYNALPQNGGETDASYEQASTLPGRVYASGTNELGDFKIGDFVTAENRTGNITFRNTVTISQLDSIALSASPDNVITQISTDNGLGDNELGGATHDRLSTQKAVKDFVVGNVGNFFEKEISTNARPNAVVQLNAQGRLNASVVPTTSGFTSYTVNEQDGRLTLHLDIPAKDLNAGNIVVEQYTDNGNDITDTYFLSNDNTSQFLIYTDNNADFADAIANTTNIAGAVSGATVTATNDVKGVLTAIDVNSIAGSGYLTDGTFVGVEIVSNTGTGALADITIASGNVTGIDLTRGGSGFADGDTIAATLGTGTPALPNRSGGVGLSATVTDVENRLFVNIDQNVGIAFSANNDEPDFIADDNASTVVIADLEDTSVKAFDSTSNLAAGDVDYTNSQINIPTHGLLSGDIVQYSVNGGTNVGGLTDSNYYYIKSIDADTIELHTNYNLDAKVTFTTQGNGTQNLTRVTVGLNTLRKTSHGLTTGQPVRVTGSDVPQGITSGDFAYIGSVTTNTFTLHTNRGDAVNSTSGTTVNEIAFTDSGTGSLTLTDQNISIVSQVNTSGSDADSWGSLNTTTIDASNIISGIVDSSRLGSGTANDKTFLRGDSSYANAVQGITASEGITLTGVDTTTDGDDTVYFNRVDLSVETATSPSAGAETKGIASFEFTDFDVTDGKVTIKDDSHNHIISNIDGLSTALSDAESNAVSTANIYTDGRETAITTAYQTYADTAEANAIATAATDATTKADAAETAANEYTDIAVANIVDTAPETLDTLNELAAALGDDPNFATTVSNSIGTKLNSSAVSAFGLTLIDDADAATARTTLGLGTAATTASTDYATAAQGALADSALQSVAFDQVTNRPTTLSGFGITDPVVLSDANIEQQPVRQYYANQSSFPSAAAWHGAIAHSHSDAAMYFAHGGVWNKLANNSDIPTNNNQLTNGAGYLTSVAFDQVTNRPTTLGGFGITDAQPLDADLTKIAGLSSANGNFIVGSATGWVAESGATVRTSLGLGSLATLSAVGASEITDNSVGAAELNVSGNGTSGQALISDGDGTFSWGAAGASLTDDTTTNTTQYIGMSRATTGSWTSAYVASTKLYFNPSSGELTATDFNSLSDVNAKTNIQTIENGLGIIESLRGVRFDWKDTGASSIGMIAQEVEEILPELVATGEEGEKRLKYANIVGVLVEAVKELSKRVSDLENGV